MQMNNYLMLLSMYLMHCRNGSWKYSLLPTHLKRCFCLWLLLFSSYKISWDTSHVETWYLKYPGFVFLAMATLDEPIINYYLFLLGWELHFVLISGCCHSLGFRCLPVPIPGLPKAEAGSRCQAQSPTSKALCRTRKELSYSCSGVSMEENHMLTFQGPLWFPMYLSNFSCLHHLSLF